MSVPSRAGAAAVEIDGSTAARAFAESIEKEKAAPVADEHTECVATTRPLGRAMVDLILGDDASFLT